MYIIILSNLILSTKDTAAILYYNTTTILYYGVFRFALSSHPTDTFQLRTPYRVVQRYCGFTHRWNIMYNTQTYIIYGPTIPS
jgi:hypothetical protein